MIHLLSTYKCIISAPSPVGAGSILHFNLMFIYYQTAHIHFTFIITIVTMNEYLCTGALEPSGDRFIRSTSEGNLLRQHSPTLRYYLKITLSTYHRMCPKFLLSASKPGKACKVSIMFSLSPLVHFTFMSY